MTPSPSGRELEILKTLWEIGPASVREVHEHMCPHGELAFNTIQTLLRIMDEKKLVKHRRKGRTFVYSAKHSRVQEARRFLDSVFDGAMDQFVLSLIQDGKFDQNQLGDLHQIIAQARQTKSPKSRPGK